MTDKNEEIPRPSGLNEDQVFEMGVEVDLLAKSVMEHQQKTRDLIQLCLNYLGTFVGDINSSVYDRYDAVRTFGTMLAIAEEHNRATFNAFEQYRIDIKHYLNLPKGEVDEELQAMWDADSWWQVSSSFTELMRINTYRSENYNTNRDGKRPGTA